MATLYLPPVGSIRVVDGFTILRKINLSKNPRSFQSGSPLWLNKVSGRYQAEPVLITATNAGTDFSSSTTNAGDTTSVDHANGVSSPLFLGIAAAARIPQQLNTIGQFQVGGGASAYAMDASKPFIEYYTEGYAYCPVGPSLSSTFALTSALEVGTLIESDGFLNEAGTGFYDSAGKKQSDTDYYLYNNCVTTTSTAANAWGILAERGEIGDTELLVKFKSHILNVATGLV